MQKKIVYKNKFTTYPFVRNYYLFLENKTNSYRRNTTGLGGIGSICQTYKLVGRKRWKPLQLSKSNII